MGLSNLKRSSPLILWVILVVILTISALPRCASAFWVNLAQVKVLQSSGQPLQSSGVVDELLRQAISIDPGNPQAAWAAGREFLRERKYASAAQVMTRWIALSPKNILLAEDLIRAFDGIGEPLQVIEVDKLRSTSQAGYSPEIRVTVVRNYLTEASDLIRADQPERAKPLLERVQMLQPGELYSTYQLYKMEPDPVLRANRLWALRHFPAEAVTLRDYRTLGLVVEIVPNLVHEQIWDSSMLRRVLAYWVWQYTESPAVEQLLANLALTDSKNLPWSCLLEELYQRRGDDAQVAHIGDCSLPSFNQETLLEMQNPGVDDILGRLIGPDAASRASTRLLMDMSVPGNTSYEWYVWSAPLDVPQNNPQFGTGAFAGGKDDFSLPSALRIDGFWTFLDQAQEPARGGFWLDLHEAQGPGSIKLISNHVYLITFLYRTDGLTDDGAMVYLCNCPDLPFRWDFLLPATNGQWRRFSRLLFNSQNGSIDVRPLLRNRGEGTVWFAYVKLFEIVGTLNSPMILDSPWEVR